MQPDLPDLVVAMRVIDALQLPSVQDGTAWIALPLPDIAIARSLPAGFTLPGQTLGVYPARGRMYWCDGYYDARAACPSHFGAEAALTLPQLLGACQIVTPEESLAAWCGGEHP